MYTFPKDFWWGAATSAPQTEGASLSVGKTATTWDYWFEQQPELFYDQVGPTDTSMLYTHYKEDCKRMKEIGFNSYRTSISWARLLPDGKTLNPEAVAFYREYFEAIHQENIEPVINLFHFDMPMWLMEKGGWEARESIDAFGFYAQTAFECFGDLVSYWTTFNEPLVHVECGYLYGYHYPAIVDFKKAIQVGYHTLLAHAKAVEAFRRVLPNKKIGIILNITPSYAKSAQADDQKAAQISNLFNTKSFLDPAVFGHVPDGLPDLLMQHELLPNTKETDRELLAKGIVDFIGLNYYHPRRVQAPLAPNMPAKMPEDLYAAYDWPEKVINPYRGWEIYPEAIYDVAIMMRDEYRNIPWFVSENGMGVADEERFLHDQELDDTYRIEFMKTHLAYLHKGISEGSHCFGYHAWTFIDCWSWLNAYKNRYGFYRVDLKTQERILKKSGQWFKQVSQQNGFEEE
ncbi:MULTISPECIES: glycoside hydrolase family 1 protein [Enterococcus]|uniref:6-phospho-beta-glucosidase n=1 Tax=Enterococcus sulfureus ATCC 49903 TaxID=1140003 RepID=S0L7K2_9ENTE|nr:glycoside hydrolase family 1 protein [Enterococcus sulfureus]EOT49400.1 hypothetical protein OMY_00328 [Enterococcus sulfureus ATCC 49903]EOT87267.1 hypothetical protein I573_00323 [Enterococcus sulfureus ATCC 49903]